MKKLTLFTALLLLAGSVVLSPVTTNAQDEKQVEFERAWYEVCFTKKPKDTDKCYQLSKELVEKHPKSTYLEDAKKQVTNYEKGKNWEKAWEKFQAALKAYYGGPDAAKLEQLFTAGEDVLKIQSDQQFVIAHLALAGAHASLPQIYKNLDKVKRYAEQALRVFEPTKAPEGWQQPDWDSLREIVHTQMYQFMGFYLIETKGNQEEAINYLTKATQIKGKDGAGWKDPNNYYFRSTVYTNQYVALQAEYGKLTDVDKTGDVGKEILKKVNDLLDTKLISDYARILATATKPENSSLKEDARRQFDQFWKYRTEAPEKAADYVKSFASDPTVAGPPVPAKAETSETAPTAPTVGPSNVKVTSSTGAPGSGAKGATSNGRNSKGTSTKGKPTPRKKRGR